jgi:hypothetical protein
MIKLDQDGYPTDFISEDYMDSAVRAGVLNICGSDLAPNPTAYVISTTGEFIRGPKTPKATNPKNFSRDQMLCLVAGLSLSSVGRTYIRSNFINRLKTFFFAQNTERDAVGSTKYQQLHYFYKDSNPNTTTVFHKEDLAYQDATIERKVFDCADILLPQHIGHMILAGKMYALYPLLLICIPFYLLDLIFHSLQKDPEENQHFCMALVYGKYAVKLYKLLNKNWNFNNINYWTDRGEAEYATLMFNKIKDI